MSVNIRNALYKVDLAALPPNAKINTRDIARIVGRAEGRIAAWRRDGDLPESLTNKNHRRGSPTWWCWADVLRFWSKRVGQEYDEVEHWRQFLLKYFASQIEPGDSLKFTVEWVTFRPSGRGFSRPTEVEKLGFRCVDNYVITFDSSESFGPEHLAA